MRRRAVLGAGIAGAGAIVGPSVVATGVAPGFGAAASVGGCTPVTGVWVENCTPEVTASAEGTGNVSWPVPAFLLASPSGEAGLDAALPSALGVPPTLDMVVTSTVPLDIRWCASGTGVSAEIGVDFAPWLVAVQTAIDAFEIALAAALPAGQGATLGGWGFDIDLTYESESLANSSFATSGLFDDTAIVSASPAVFYPFSPAVGVGSPCVITACPGGPSCDTCTDMPTVDGTNVFSTEIGGVDDLFGTVTVTIDLVYNPGGFAAPIPLQLTWISAVVPGAGDGTGLIGESPLTVEVYNGSFSCELP